MSYKFYLGGILLPVAPASFEVKHGNKLKKTDLLSGEEIVIKSGRAVNEMAFTALLPQTQYPFAVYSKGFKKGNKILNEIIKLKESDKPFRFIVIRKTAKGKKMFSNNVKAVFSELRVKEDAGNGFDISIDVKLTEYRDYSVKKVKSKGNGSGTATRSTDTAPTVKTYTVVKGDCLWMIAHRFMGNGNRYKELYNANKAVIDAWNKGTGNTVYTIYPGQVFIIPS